MVSEKMVEELNVQIKMELYSGHLYLAMAAYCASIDFDGFANFFIVQEQEERFHAMKLFKYIGDQDKDVKIYGLEQPRTEYKSLEDVFKVAWKHEQVVTRRFYDLMDLAVNDKDYTSQGFFKWYIDEQVEEETTMLNILKKIRLLGEKGQGIYMLDKDLAQRTFSPPALKE